ncbi:hypothetical protein C8T65DRAFT_717920 [Cerioporus squamosus]|nr:hypothetical protein C8T65DRAFT_717920 [Cerioporus squamosus]
MSAESNLSGSYAYTDTLKGVFYGPGSVKTALPQLLDILGAKKALIVTGKSLFHKTDVVKTVENILRERNAYGATFYEIGEHSPVAGIRAGVQKFKDVGADVIVSVGGGSPVDASKAILYFVQQEHGGRYLPQIAIPTTLSAAEYTVGAGYTNDEGHKVAVIAPELAPSGVILDAELTLSTPERLWLSTGIRALDHAVENLYRPLAPPPIKHLCYGAIADLFKYLPISKANPQDIVARQKLQIASWMSLWPVKLSKFRCLGATYGIPHGITSCLTLAPVVALMAETASKEDKEWLAGALFQPPQAGDIKQLSVEIHSTLVDGLGLHSTLSQYKVPKGDVQTVAERAVVNLLEGIYA